MTKADKKIVKTAMDALQVYWYTHGATEWGRGEVKCGVCSGCIHCDLEDAWSAWENAETKLKELIA